MAALILLAAMLLLFIVLLIRRGVHLSPRDVLSNYLTRTISGRTEEAYHYLSSKNKTDHSLQDYQTGHSLGSGLIANLLARNISFTVEKMDIRNDQAAAVVTLRAPDFKQIMGDVFQGIAPDRIPERNLEAFIFLCRKISHYLDKYPRDATPMKTSTETYHLIREKGGWKVCLEEIQDSL